MITRILLILLYLSGGTIFAQIEMPSNPMRIDPVEKNKNNPTGYELPSSKTPSLTIPKEHKLSKKEEDKKEKEDFSMVDDEFIEFESKLKPKVFSKDKEIKPEYGEDLYLGDVSTNSKSVSIMYRDHEYVDGDRIRIFVNGDMMIANVMLEAKFKGFDFDLEDGFNKVEFEALNQGSSGPNTAQMQIRDEQGNVLATYEWNLLTGNKATAIVVKKSL